MMLCCIAGHISKTDFDLEVEKEQKKVKILQDVYAQKMAKKQVSE
jgi:hypothetical protein